MTLLESWRLERGIIGSATFRGRVRSGMIKGAIFIHSEPDTTPNHTARLQWAKMALQNPDHHAKLILAGVCANAEIVAAGGDADDALIFDTLRDIVDAYAPYLEEVVASASLEGYTGEAVAEAPARGERFRDWLSG